MSGNAINVSVCACSVPEISCLNSAVESPGSQGATDLGRSASEGTSTSSAQATSTDGMNRRSNGEVFLGQDTDSDQVGHAAFLNVDTGEPNLTSRQQESFRVPD